jgi:hypothetical protein
MTNPIDEAIARLHKVFREEKEDFAEAEEIRKFIEHLASLKPAYDAWTTGQKFKTRHARPSQWRRDLDVTMSTFWRCWDLVDSEECRSMAKAQEKVSSELGVDYETIKKRCIKARSLLRTPAVQWTLEDWQKSVIFGSGEDE